MIPQEVLKQVRLLHLWARRAVQGQIGGEYRSIFRGQGIAFEEVREYQPGDDVRSIDWNVTARMGHPYVKRFVEERELTLFLLVDWSASLDFGTGPRTKREVAAELAALLAASAAGNHDRVGLVAFTDKVERFLPPQKGAHYVLRIIRAVLFPEASSPATSLAEALGFLHRIWHRRAVVFVLSDFFDRGYERALTRAGRYHDLVAIQITDPREESLPVAGLVEVQDAETGRRISLDTGLPAIRAAFARASAIRRQELRRICRDGEIDLLEVTTAGGHLEALFNFFLRRHERLRRL
jgi:uncharacterized protein (DUF58 family)